MDEQAKTEYRVSFFPAFAGLLVLLVGWVDYATGEELSVSILYLVPIYLCAWRVGRRCGLAAAVASVLAWLAHEVKNPLMTLTMVADYLAQMIPAQEPEAAPMLQDMRDAIGRANRVISELLEFSRPGGLTLQPEDLHVIVDRALSLVKLELTRCHIEVVREFGPALPVVPMDKNKIEQVLVNVFMNAIQAMPQGGTLVIRTSAAPTGLHDARAITLEIDDTGPGVSDASLARVFEPFFTTKAVSYGTGLGLSVARQIVQSHGGTIDLRNRTEGGARVTIVLNSALRN